MAAPGHTIVETPTFIRAAERAGLDESERARIVDAIASDPTQGDEVQGTGGIRKVRVAGRGKGKSGGYRVMVAYFGPEWPTYLVAVLSKGEKANFDRSEIAAMKDFTAAIKQAWRGRRRR